MVVETADVSADVQTETLVAEAADKEVSEFLDRSAGH